MLSKVTKIFPKPKLSSSNELSPIFIIGCGRSGNTLQRRILMAGGDVYIPPETYVLGKVIKTWLHRIDMSWEDRVAMVFHKISGSQDFESFPTKDLRPALKAALELPIHNRTLADVLDIIYRYLAHEAGHKNAILWGDKTPMNTKSLAYIDRLFPSAKYIHMIRNPLDTVCSMKTMGRYRDIDTCSRRWVSSNLSCLSFAKSIPPERYIQVHYEDMVSEPELSQAEVCRFLGIDFHPGMITPQGGQDLGDVSMRQHHARVKDQIDNTSIGKSMKALHLFERKSIHLMCGKLAKKMDCRAYNPDVFTSVHT